MRKLVFAVVTAASMSGLALSAQAAGGLGTVSADQNIVQVAQGCGIGGHRLPSGRCVPNHPVFRGCPRGLHMDRFGHCRPNL